MDGPVNLYLDACVRSDRAAHSRRMRAFGERYGVCPYCSAKGKMDSDEKCGNPYRKSHREAQKD